MRSSISVPAPGAIFVLGDKTPRHTSAPLESPPSAPWLPLDGKPLGEKTPLGVFVLSLAWRWLPLELCPPIASGEAAGERIGVHAGVWVSGTPRGWCKRSARAARGSFAG